MTLRRRLVSIFLDWTDGWNSEIHDAIERKVLIEFKRTFPDGITETSDRGKIIADMRAFYYARMTNTAMILIAAIAFLVAVASLIVSVIALKH